MTGAPRNFDWLCLARPRSHAATRINRPVQGRLSDLKEPAVSIEDKQEVGRSAQEWPTGHRLNAERPLTRFRVAGSSDQCNPLPLSTGPPARRKSFVGEFDTGHRTPRASL